MNKEILIQWYKDNGINDVIQETPISHLDVSRATLPQIKPKITQDISVKKFEMTIENKVQIISETESGEKINIKTKESVRYSNDGNKKEFNFNYIYQNLANKYRNDNIKIINENKSGNITDFINKAREFADKANNIDELRDFVENFDGYLDIKKLATNTVFGEGNTKADIMIIGEAPGNNEDLEGKPFCGQSGQLLESMFKAIGINRNEMYISNTLFWRPPGNRTPTEEEITICRPFVEKHIALIDPKIIIFMGATALKDLIETDLTITKARRKLFNYTNKYLNGKTIKTTPLFHPSYLLRQSSKKKDAWGDLLFVKSILET